MTNKQQPKLLGSVSQMDTKDCSPQETQLAQKTVQVEMSLRIISKAGLFNCTAEQAWKEGTNILTALRVNPEKTREAVVGMVKLVSEYIDAKKRLNTVPEYAMVSEMIFKDFPTLKLEEIRLIADRMMLGKYGNYFERLKAPEFRKCFVQHESERSSILETQHMQIYRGADDPTNVPEYDAEAAKLAWRLKNNPFLIPNKNQQND